MLSSLCQAEMDDDGKNSETDLVGGELWVPQNTLADQITALGFSHQRWPQEFVKGQCLSDIQKIHSHVYMLTGLWKLNNHTQALDLHCRAWCVSSVSWAGCAGTARQRSHQAVCTPPVLGLIYVRAGACLAVPDTQLWGSLLGLLRALLTLTQTLLLYWLKLLDMLCLQLLHLGTDCFSAEWAGSTKFTGKLFERILRILWGFFPHVHLLGTC